MATAEKPPTGPQLRYLRQLAQRTGTTFTNPATRRQASAEIKRLQAIRTRGFTFAELAAEHAAREAGGDAPLTYAPAIRHDEETVGYGASATWSHRA